MTKRTQAIVAAGAWKLPTNSVWNIPTDTDEVRFDYTIINEMWGFSIISKMRALAITMCGKIYGERSASYPCPDGYTAYGRISINGKKVKAFSSSKLFEREDGSLCDVAVWIIR